MASRLHSTLVVAIAGAGIAAVASAQHQARVAAALEKARPALLAHLLAAANSAPPGELALVTLAALHDGVPLDQPEFAAALRKLAVAVPTTTYDLSLRLLVLEAHAGFPDREALAAADATELRRHCDAGAFHYLPGGGWDLSNSQYGALGLRAARSLGVSIADSVWTRLAEVASTAQASNGGFGYEKDARPTMSMTVAGIAVLQICDQALDPADGHHGELQSRIGRAWKWLEQHRREIGSARTDWCLYAHYGLERAAILCDVATVADVDWYARGAEMLCDQQLKGGGFGERTGYEGQVLGDGRGMLVPTSFAVLFLRRKFQKVPAPITPGGLALDRLDASTPPAEFAACVLAQVRRGEAGLVTVVDQLRSSVPRRRYAALVSLQMIAGSTFGFRASAGSGDNAAALQRIEVWLLERRRGDR